MCLCISVCICVFMCLIYCCFYVPDCLHVYERLWLSKYVTPCKEDDRAGAVTECVCVCVRLFARPCGEPALSVDVMLWPARCVELGLLSAAFPLRCEGQLSHNLQRTTRTILFPRPQQSRTQPHPAPRAPSPSRGEKKHS